MLACFAAVANANSYEAPDDCDWHQVDNDVFAVSLTCHLSAINSDQEKTNFSVIPSRGTQSLTVRCTESDLSKLERNAFANLHELEELNIEDCKIERIPAGVFSGLGKLRRLKISAGAKLDAFTNCAFLLSKIAWYRLSPSTASESPS